MKLLKVIITDKLENKFDLELKPVAMAVEISLYLLLVIVILVVVVIVIDSSRFLE